MMMITINIRRRKMIDTMKIIIDRVKQQQKKKLSYNNNNKRSTKDLHFLFSFIHFFLFFFIGILHYIIPVLIHYYSQVDDDDTQ